MLLATEIIAFLINKVVNSKSGDLLKDFKIIAMNASYFMIEII